MMRWIGFCCFLLGILPLNAQEYIAKVSYFGVEQGLSYRQVNTITQDHRGFMWLGTMNGLNRFDGHGFRVYTKERNGLHFNGIRALIEDAEGWIWLFPIDGTGACLFQPDAGTVMSLAEKFDKSHPGFAAQNFISCLNTADGAIWLTTKGAGGLYRYHPKEGLQSWPVAGYENIKLKYYSPDNTFWANTEERTVIEIDRQGKIIRKIENAWFNGEWNINDAGMLVESINPGEKKGFLRMFNLKGELLPFDETELTGSIAATPLLVLPLNNEGDFVLHDRVMHRRDGEKARWNFPAHAEGNMLWRSFFKDKKGRYWLGDDFGLYMLELNKSRFKRYLYQKDIKPGLGTSVRGIVTRKDRLWVNADQQGLFEINLGNGQAHLRPDSRNFGNYALIPMSDGEIWSGREKSIYRFFPDKAAGTVLPTNIDAWFICEDAAGNRWIGTADRGLCIMPPGSDTPQPFTQFNGFEDLKTAFVLYIAKDPQGYLWACAGNGLYKIDPQRGVLGHWWAEGKGEYHLPSDNIYHCCIDASGVFWLSTTNGLLRVPSRAGENGSRNPAWDDATGKCFNRSNGLPSDIVYAAYEDKHGRLWLPTDQGITCLDKQTEWIRVYFEADGIAHNEFNRTAHFQAEDGTLYFGGLNGITAFHPDAFQSGNEQLFDIPLVVTRFDQLDGSGNQLVERTGELLRTGEITLQPDDRYFSLEIALLSYETVNPVQYAWKIDGLDRDWHYQNERHINYGGLPYGTYTLHIKGRSAGGRWSEAIQITIHALRPWYLQYWFLALMALLAAYGIRWYIRRRSRYHIEEQKKLEGLVAKATERIELDKQTIQRQAEELRHLDRVKSNFFANVSHELRTPLTLMLGPLGSVLKRNKLDNQDFTLIKLAQMHARQLLQLVNQILDLSKMESDKLELRETPVRLYPFLRRVAAAFESHADQRGILFSFRFNAEKDICLLLDAPKVETILNNLLSNALKFTPPNAGGKVELSVESLGHSLRITVSDNGRGIHPDDLPNVFNRFYQSQQPNAPIEGGTGIGLALCKELAELMQGSIRAESAELGAGSAFYLEIPQKEVLGLQAETPEDELPETFDAQPIVAAPELPDGQVQGPLILVVEDNASLRSYVQAVLGAQYRVVCAGNGAEALAYLSEHPAVSLIISDIMMPVMDGFQLLQHLKNTDAYWQVPVIMLTARADVRDQLKALRIGVDDYLLKPFESEELLARVSALLERSGEKARLLPEKAEQEEAQEPVEAAPSAAELAFLEELESVVRRELRNESLSVSWLAAHFYMSERQLQRRINRLTGLSPNAYLREVRLEAARALLEERNVASMKAAAWEVGFRDEKHFSQLFRERFGKSPAEYLR